MDRLADSSGPDGSYEYDYDLNGNRNWHKRNTVQTSYTYNAARTRLQALSGGVNETRLYDASGNTTQIDGRNFNHNEQNRLWRYQEGSVSIEYRHNAFGERQVKDDGATITRFVYDGPRLMHERTGASPRDYIYLEGQLVGLVQNGSLYFVHTDHLGRPEIVTNGAKSVRWSAQNNAFGNIPATDLIGGLHIAFPGQYYDIESGTYYNYFRTYDATTGRYLQSDPIGLAGGLNTYSYARNNPLGSIDPLGLNPFNARILDEILADEEQIDGVQDWLTKAGYAGPIGPFADATNCTISVTLGNYEDAAWSALGIFGIFDGVKAARDLSRGVRGSDNVPNGSTRRASRPETPYPDATGRYHGDIPGSVPREWKAGEVDDAIEGLQRSINQRKREIRRFGDSDQLPGHIERLRREENFMKQLQKRRGEISGD